MLQAFDDLVREWRGQTIGMVLFLLGIYIETTACLLRQHIDEARRGEMKGEFLNPVRAAAVAMLMLLPVSFVYVVAAFSIEPLNGFFVRLGDETHKTVTLSFLLGIMLLMPVGFAVNLVPVVRGFRRGESAFASPVNVAAGVIIASAIAYLWGSIIIDQIPCWMGVPNCD